jgi:uncharacterized membrane-anchored protein
MSASLHPAADPRLTALIQAAIAKGLLPAGATAPRQDSRPWPVVLLTALGAWLAGLPLLGAFWMLFGDWLSRSAGLYVAGVLLLTAAIVTLRARGVPLFVEQLAIPALLVGGGTLGFGLFRDLNAPLAATVLCAVALGVGVGLVQPWLRVLLGAAAAALFALACVPERRLDFLPAHLWWFWFAWHVSLGVWLAAVWAQREARQSARLALALESLSAGWLLATLVGLAWWSGMTFLVGANLGGGMAGDVMGGTALHGSAGWQGKVSQAVSLALAALAATRAASRWPVLRTPAHGAVALVLMGLAWFMPTLGAVLLGLAVCVTTSRWRLAATAALAAAWIVGAFYYTLQWPLATKALVLVGAGAVLGALAWFAAREARGPGDAAAPHAGPSTAFARGAAAAIGLSAVAVLAVANFAIWQKEDLIANGQPVFVELAPVDPRSLMQGDFMRLNFRMPADVQTNGGGVLTSKRPHVIAKRDARGIATLDRLDTGAPLAPDEMRIELTPKSGRWILVSDAWFFAEGEAKRWEAAKYGEFRVEPGGRALLVGLRGANLEAL